MTLLSCVVPIKNGINFRDLGGIETNDGRKIRSGLLFRSGDFSKITDKEQTILSNDLEIKNILDYRDKHEMETKPDNLWPHVQYVNIPANPMSREVTANLTDELMTAGTLKKLSPTDFMIQLYQLLPFNNPAYHKLANLLLNNNGESFVQHCAIGKDRTGVGVALTLFALGVDEKTVMEDYLLTDVLLKPFKDALLDQYKTHLSDEELEKRQHIFAAKPIYLQSALNAIKEKYQTIDHWLEAEYQLTPINRRRIQDYYLI